MRCEEVGELLAGAVDGSVVLDRQMSRHVEACLRCQAELAQYRRLLRVLHQLREDPVLVPSDLPALIAARLDGVARAGDRSRVHRRVAYAGALAATAAGAAGAIALVATRSRRMRLAS